MSERDDRVFVWLGNRPVGTLAETARPYHTTTVDGNGRDPGMRELVNVGTRAGLSRKACEDMAEGVRQRAEKVARDWRDPP